MAPRSSHSQATLQYRLVRVEAIAAIGVGGAPGGDLDEACAKAENRQDQRAAQVKKQ